MNLPRHFATSDGLRIAYYIDDFTDPWKAPETALLLHAGMGSSQRWYAMVPKLARHYRVVRMDLRGHGQSEVPRPDSELSLQRLTKDVAELMDHLSLDEAHFICNATGGYLGQHLAATEPRRVSSLALFSSTPGQKNAGTDGMAAWLPRIRELGLRRYLEQVVFDRLPVARLDPGYVRWYVDEAAKNDTEFLLRLLGLMSQLDLSDELPRIACPTLVVVPGANHKPGSGPYAVMAERIRDLKMVYYEGEPQGLCDASPDRCAEEALAFLREKFGRDG